MYGKNKRMQQRVDDTGEMLNVTEIFSSIQGEGMYSGTPAVFVRLSGCCNGCYFCDTDFEQRSTTPVTVLVASIEHLAAINGTRLVVITGGEPLIQNILRLITRLHNAGFQVQVETSGAVWFLPEWIGNKSYSWLIPYHHAVLVAKTVTFVVSPKLEKVHEAFSLYADCWKYVVEWENEATDGLPIQSTQVKGRHEFLARPSNSAPVYVQPMDVLDPVAAEKNIQAAILCTIKHNYRLSLQIHKILKLK